MADFTIKQNDRSPSIACLLSYSNGTLPNLAGASVAFIFKLKNGTGAARSGIAVIEDAPTCKVRYDWAAGDTATPGTYNAEWEVTFPGGIKGTFPSNGYLELEITDDLNDA